MPQRRTDRHPSVDLRFGLPEFVVYCLGPYTDQSVLAARLVDVIGRDPKTGSNRKPALELARLTIPRRVYTQAHMDVIAEAAGAVYARRGEPRGMQMTYEPKYLRFFQARFEPL